MIGLGYRREMHEWDLFTSGAEFFEIAPENWLMRDRERLHEIRALGRPIYLHGVSLNLGGNSPMDVTFLKQVRNLAKECQSPFYSDHLAASGDAHQLYDLFPIPRTRQEVRRVSDRIRHAQDVLGFQMAVENATWYTNVGELSEVDFLLEVLERADCLLLLDLNNIVVNHKNHGLTTLMQFIDQVNFSRVSYLHVAGHEFDDQLNMYIDTHSRPVETSTARIAKQLAREKNLDVLLEWDNDVPSMDIINRELACLQPFMNT